MTTGAGTYSSSMAGAGNYNQWIVDTFRPYVGDSLLEVGIGHGGFHDLMPGLGRYVGIDIDIELVERARLAHPERRYVKGDVAATSLPGLVGDDYSSVMCVNVLEHIEDQNRALANMIGCVVRGGHILLLVPAFPWLFTDLDRLAGHMRRYTKAELASVIPSSADVVRLGYFNPIGGIGWAANKLLPHRSLESGAVKAQVAFFDRYLLPVSRLVDPLTRQVFGQSVVCVARKR